MQCERSRRAHPSRLRDRRAVGEWARHPPTPPIFDACPTRGGFGRAGRESRAPAPHRARHAAGARERAGAREGSNGRLGGWSEATRLFGAPLSLRDRAGGKNLVGACREPVDAGSLPRPSLGREPLLECAAPRDREAVEKGALPVLVEMDGLGGQSDLLPDGRDGTVAQVPADQPDCFVQRMARTGLRTVAPEEPDEVLARASAPWRLREIDEQREMLAPEQLRRRDGGVELGRDGPERPDAHHGHWTPAVGRSNALTGGSASRQSSRTRTRCPQAAMVSPAESASSARRIRAGTPKTQSTSASRGGPDGQPAPRSEFSYQLSELSAAPEAPMRRCHSARLR